MEDLQPISDVEQAPFCVELAKRLNMMRRQDQLCDVTLVTIKDGTEFKAHRNVFSATSQFFSKLLQSDMKENREGIVRFKEISGAVMEDILEFIYTGSVEVTKENSDDLIVAANYLLIPVLKKLSARFLERHMSKSNCISTFYFAEMYQCDELITNTRKFIHANFASVAENDEFLNLEAKEVERWISTDEICVADDADVFKIVLKWIDQNKSERIISRDFLIDVVTNELALRNLGCSKLISDAVNLRNFTCEAVFLQSPRKGLENRAIVVCGGKHTFCYLPEKDEWKRLADGLSVKNNLTKMLSYRDQLYSFSYLGMGERYDPVLNCWSILDLSTTWSVTKVAVVRGEMYSIEFDTPKCTIKRYDVERCLWEVSSSREGYCHDSCVVGAGNHLYVCGWKPKAERFDTVENKWEEIANMQQKRGEAFGAATEGKIFVAGRRQGFSTWLKTCEMYTISTNEWQFIGSLNAPRVNGCMVCLKGTLYVLGGTESTDDLSHNHLIVECYDPTEDKWIRKTTIPVKTISNDSSFAGCVQKLFTGVLDKLDVIKE